MGSMLTTLAIALVALGQVFLDHGTTVAVSWLAFAEVFGGCLVVCAVLFSKSLTDKKSRVHLLITRGFGHARSRATDAQRGAGSQPAGEHVGAAESCGPLRCPCRAAPMILQPASLVSTGSQGPGAGGAIGRVGMWRGRSRLGLSVAAPFVWRCPSNLAIAPFPHPSHRTGLADRLHPALGQDLTPSPTTRRAQAGTDVRDRSTRTGARVDSSRPGLA